MYTNDKNYSLLPFHHLIWITEENFQRFVIISRPSNTNSKKLVVHKGYKGGEHESQKSDPRHRCSHTSTSTTLFISDTFRPLNLFQRFREIALQIIMIMLCRTAANKEYIFVCSHRDI